jgi:hypothetical protein
MLRRPHTDAQAAQGGALGTAPAETDGVLLLLLLLLLQMAWGVASRWIRSQLPARALLVQQVRGVVLCTDQHCLAGSGTALQITFPGCAYV